MNSKQIIAFCNDATEQLRTEIYDEFSKNGIEVYSGKQALNLVKNKEIRPENIYVVQEILAEDAQKLIELGANPLVLTSGEAPIYAPIFYDELEEIAKKFPYKILFRGAIDRLGGENERNHVLHFPLNIGPENLNEIVPWNERKEIVMVVANKFCKLKFPTTLEPKSFFRKLKTFLSPSFRESVKNNFQTKRLESIEFFGNLEKLDLYGGGWNKKKDIPALNWKKLKPILKSIYKGKCDNKIEVISKYKFAIAFENIAYPGYITEKITDCFAAGVIPIYLGAPDIEDFIPKNCFIDVRDFENFDELDNYLKNIDEKEAMDIIRNGREFLYSEEGQKYKMQSFAKTIVDFLIKANRGNA